MSYTLREHTADIAVEATAPTLAALFESVGDGPPPRAARRSPRAGIGSSSP